MEDYQKRVIDEKNELDRKINKLNNFIYKSDTFLTLDPVEQAILKTQCDTMEEYSDILLERIRLFDHG